MEAIQIAEHLITLAQTHTKREGHPCFDYGTAISILYPDADTQEVFAIVTATE